jgi:hypothetical protein
MNDESIQMETTISRKIFAVASFFLLLAASNASAQNAQLQILNMLNNGSVLDVKIQIKSSATFGLATSNLVFAYTAIPDTCIANPVLLTAHNFSGGSYSPMTMSVPAAGRLSLNINLSKSPATDVSTTWMDVATVRFTTKDPLGGVNFAWRLSGPGRTYVWRTTTGTPALLTVDTATGLDVNPLPITLAAFSGRSVNGNVVLNWKTVQEANSYGFDIQRSTTGSVFESIGFIPANNAGASVQEYTYCDPAPVASSRLWYRLLMKEYDGSSVVSPYVIVSMERTMSAPHLNPLYPNPIIDVATISFSLPSASSISLRLFDVHGRLIRGYAENEFLPAGFFTRLIDKANLSGGNYLLELTSGDFQQTISVVVR